MEIPKHSGSGNQEELQKMAEKMPQRGRVMGKIQNPFISGPQGEIRSDGKTYSEAMLMAYLRLSKAEADDIHRIAFNEVKAKTPKGQPLPDDEIFHKELELASLLQYRKALG